MSEQPSLIVHGGAGDFEEEVRQSAVDGVRSAAASTWQVLLDGGSALDAVELATRIMEDDPAFDAGYGSFLNLEGKVQLDAMIMDGRTLNNGAVAAVEQIANPVSLARAVMQQCQHTLLVGDGARAYAAQIGFAEVSNDALVTERELKRWKSLHNQPLGHDTVGAIARDRDGNLAVATSTGGTLNKFPGRVGDSPLVGCGGYADNLLGAASATGRGEDLIKIVMCKTICDLMGTSLDAQSAAEAALRRLEDPRVNGKGGVICIDPFGRIGFAYNTPFMARAYFDPDGTLVAEI